MSFPTALQEAVENALPCCFLQAIAAASSTRQQLTPTWLLL
jgi:hypothetical protein